MKTPIVAIIGRPNVGKSTLFNRIIRKPLAITDDMPGVTRDRNAYEFEWNSRTFMFIDTGGYVLSSTDPMERAVCEQSLIAMEEADTVLFLVDVKSGITDLDSGIREILIKSNKPVILAVTKIDSTRNESDLYEFYNLGIGEPYPVSGLTGRGTGDLLDAIVETFPPDDGIETEDPDALRIALIGRPNVGKSSIVNSLTGKNSVLVTDIAGTTRDSTDTHLDLDGRHVILVDTAGLKRITKLKESLEYYSYLRTKMSLSRCDIAAVVIDINVGLTSYEKRLVSDVTESGKGLIIIANKWDLITKDHATMKKNEQAIFDDLPDKTPYPIVFTSALTGQRVKKIVETAVKIDAARKTRIQTSELNKFAESVKIPPTVGELTIYYCTQFGVDPPKFAFFVNNVKKINDGFKRYLEGQLRKEFGFFGTPITLSFKGKKRDLTSS